MAHPNAPRRRSCALALLLALAAALPAALLAAPIDAAVAAPQAGEACGPNDHGRWISATALAASGGAAVDGSGCISSDSGAGAFVRADLGASHTVYSAYFTGSGSGRAALRVGHVDITRWVEAMRAGEHELEAVLATETQCAAVTLGAAPAAVDAACTAPPGKSTVGGFVTILAPSARVCGLMVCGQRLLFSASGTPLSPEAAQLDRDNAQRWTPVDAQPSGAATLLGAASRRLQSWMPLDNRCPSTVGNDYYNDKRCPDGGLCMSYYKPGDGACSCFSCSAFTEPRQCNQGDVEIRRYECCFSCPYQPICGSCCNNQITSIEVAPARIPLTPDSWTPGASQLTASAVVTNNGPDGAQLQTTFAFTPKLQSTLRFSNPFTATLVLGLPFINEAGQLEWTPAQNLTLDTPATATARTLAVAYNLTQQVPSLMTQALDATAPLGTLTVTVPLTVKTTYTCTGVQTDSSSAILTVTGVPNPAAALDVKYGPQLAPDVYGQADASCASNPLCSQLGQTTGNCCPGDNGVYSPCCAQCVAKPACAGFAQDNSTMCCPTRSNQYMQCCSQ